MNIVVANDRNADLIEQLVDVWERSVKATHLFLSAQEIEEIKKYVPEVLNAIAHLVMAVDENMRPVAFMGVENRKLEMLFLSPEKRGHGLGKRLIHYGVENYSVEEVTVNVQNPQAIGFYEHMGFKTYKRTEHDEQGMPHPLLYMKLDGAK